MWFFGMSLAAHALTFEELIADPVTVLLADKHTPAQFRIIALSHAAEACVGRHRDGDWTMQQSATCLQTLARAALDPRLSPYGVPVGEVVSLGEHGLFLTHLAIVLGARDEIDRSTCDETLHERIISRLVEASLEHPSGVGRSYPASEARWPADQAATTYALWLYDRTHGATRSQAPLARYLASLPAEGLPRSELTGTVKDADKPRGSAIAYTVRYLAPVSPVTARMLWGRANAAGFIGKVGPLTALREWPPKIDRPADVDSGPIVNGFGAAATAFGRAAARAIGSEQAAALDRTVVFGHQLSKSTPGMSSTAQSSLSIAISAQTDIEHPLGAAPKVAP